MYKKRPEAYSTLQLAEEVEVAEGVPKRTLVQEVVAAL